MDDSLKKIMSREFNRIIPDIKESRLDSFEIYYDELVKWQRRMNLTSLHGQDLIQKLFIESLLFSKVFEPKEGLRILDIGTGSGVPGLPLKLVFNKIELHLLDKNRKKINFLKNLVYKVHLKDVFFHNMRVEEFLRDGKYSNFFDVITSRAISLPDNVILLFKSVLKNKGAYIKKGRNDEKAESDNSCKVEIENPRDKNSPYIFDVYTKDYLLQNY